MLEQENERLMEQLNSLTNAVDQVRAPVMFSAGRRLIEILLCKKMSAQSLAHELLGTFYQRISVQWIDPPRTLFLCITYGIRYRSGHCLWKSKRVLFSLQFWCIFSRNLCVLSSLRWGKRSRNK
jgi:hypothetical protein